MSEIEQRVREDVRRVGILWRQHSMAGDSEQEAFYDGWLNAMADVLAWLGVDSDEVARLFDEAKGVES